MKLKLLFFSLVIISIIAILSSCSGSGNSPANAFDTTGWDETDLGNGITHLLKKDADGKTLQEGYLHNGIQEGMWIEYHSDGDIIKSITPYINGTVTGPAMTLSNRSQLESLKSYGNNTLHGLSNSYKYGKLLSTTPYNMNKINGKFREFKNGKIQREIDYVNGKKDGKIIYYDEEGNVTVEYVYKNDEKISGGMIEK